MISKFKKVNQRMRFKTMTSKLIKNNDKIVVKDKDRVKD